MRYEFLISTPIFAVAILLLVATMSAGQRYADYHRYYRGKAMDTKNATQVAAEAAVKDVLGVKEQPMDGLSKRLALKKNAMGRKGNRPLSPGTWNLMKLTRLRDKTRQGLDNLLGLFNESVRIQKGIRMKGKTAQEIRVEQLRILEAAERQLEEMNNFLKQAQAEVDVINESLRLANIAAEEAKEKRDEALQKLMPKIKKWKHVDF